MNGRVSTVLLVTAALAGGFFLAGCASDRIAQLRRRGDALEAKLLAAQAQTTTLAQGERDAKLHQLEFLRTALAATNVARDNINSIPASATRNALYSVTAEAYGMIEWRINMPPGPEDKNLANLRFRTTDTGAYLEQGGDPLNSGPVSRPPMLAPANAPTGTR